MPLIQISHAVPIAKETKSKLINKLTSVVVEELNVPESSINIILTQVDATDWGVGGVPLSTIFNKR